MSMCSPPRWRWMEIGWSHSLLLFSGCPGCPLTSRSLIDSLKAALPPRRGLKRDEEGIQWYSPCEFLISKWIGRKRLWCNTDLPNQWWWSNGFETMLWHLGVQWSGRKWAEKPPTLLMLATAQICKANQGKKLRVPQVKMGQFTPWIGLQI